MDNNCTIFFFQREFKRVLPSIIDVWRDIQWGGTHRHAVRILAWNVSIVEVRVKDVNLRFVNALISSSSSLTFLHKYQLIFVLTTQTTNDEDPLNIITFNLRG
ncbi:hypothetical protein Dimus_017264 [Dionaea muscipula]